MVQQPTAPTLLALRALKLGDLLVAVPALNGLRRAFPEHRIVLATSAWLAPVVGLVAAVDELLPAAGLSRPLEVEAGTIDVAVNLHGRGPESGDLIAALRPTRLIAHRPRLPQVRTRRNRFLLAGGALPDDRKLTLRLTEVRG